MLILTIIIMSSNDAGVYKYEVVRPGVSGSRAGCSPVVRDTGLFMGV